MVLCVVLCPLPNPTAEPTGVHTVSPVEKLANRTTGTLPVRAWYGRGSVMVDRTVRSSFVHGTVAVRSWYGHGTVEVR